MVLIWFACSWVEERKQKDAQRTLSTPMYRPYVWLMEQYAMDMRVTLPAEWPSCLPVMAALYRPDAVSRLFELRSKL